MTKKMLVVALALTATLLLTANSFGQACSTSASIALNAVGSSAQFNTWAYATVDYIKSYSTAGFNLFSVKGNISNGPPAVPIAGTQDTRTSPATLDTSTLWVMWDNNAACKVYAYTNQDSGIGQRIFYATTAAGAKAGLPYWDSSLNGGGGTGGSHGQVGGLADTTTTIPSVIYTAMMGNGTTTFPVPFNAAPTDLRPEDVLFGTNRALNALDAVKYTGFGYSQAGCGGTSTVGCVVYTAMSSGKYFNVIKYALGGTDPITGGTIAAYTTTQTGAAPVVVFVSDTTTTTGGLGSTSGGKYIYNNINRQVLTGVFSGQFSRTTDIVAQLPTVPGAGQALQVFQREPLSGTYNTFEFTAVRTLGGSNNPLVGASAASVIDNANNSQEFGNNPTTNFGTANCPEGTGFPVSGSTCGDPLFLPTGSGGHRIRTIGTGEEVSSVLNLTKNQSTSTTAASNGIGYAFWSYGNFAPTALPSGCVGGACTSYLGHYLTVDGIDPLFNTPGGALDSTPNPNGAYHLPTCNLNSLPCFNIPFTHVYDGTYPLWTILRVVTPKPAPAVVTSIVKFAQQEVLSSARFTSDFVPLTDGNNNLNLFVFRSHQKQQGVSPNNGHASCSNFHPITSKPGKACLVDAGGDAGGSVVTVQADVDWNHDFGSVAGQPVEYYGLHQ